MAFSACRSVLLRIGFLMMVSGATMTASMYDDAQEQEQLSRDLASRNGLDATHGHPRGLRRYLGDDSDSDDDSDDDSDEDGYVSPFTEVPWEEGCDDSDYDYHGTLKFCQDGATFGYRLEDTDPCGALAPLIRMQAGKSYQLRLENQANEVTNIHTHGLHIPGSGNSDDITREVSGGKCLFYNWTLPDDHLDGTFWYHAHVFGHTEPQVNGGALGMLVIDPAEGSSARPDWVENNERLLLLASSSNGTRGVPSVVLANGNSAEQIELTADTWHHLRVAVGDPRANVRDILFDDSLCTVHAVAYDGVWRTSVPKSEQYTYTLTGANRIDFAIKCSASSGLYYDVEDTTGDPLVKFIVSGTGSDGDLETWIPDRPTYLEDLTGLTMSTTFTVSFSRRLINGKSYDEDIPLAFFTHDTTQQWNIRGSGFHVHHLHMYHTQVVTPGGCGNIYEEGQWYDTISSYENMDCLVRFHLHDIGGRTIFHCHILSHEDAGMMGWVNVTGGPAHGTDHTEELDCDNYCFADE